MRSTLKRPTSPRARAWLALVLALTALGAATAIGGPAAMAVGTATTATTASATGAAGTVTIGGLCLDDSGSGTADGNPILTYSCTGGANQNWTWNADGTVTVFGKCLDVTGGANATGALVQLSACASGAAQQKFKWLPDTTIYSAKSGKCLAVQGGSVVSGARIGLAPCDPSQAAEKWKATTAPGPKYTLTGGSAVSFANADDTPASVYTDADGKFYYQESHSLYGKTDGRSWTFYQGSNFDTATANNASTQNKAADNADTTTRCNNSPTGLTATSAPAGSGYSQRNFCDLSGTWVDPDTGWWYGLVHNEFTPQPFGDGLHYDAIDYAVSKDHGVTWTIAGHAITSPYSTTRNDTAAFPNQTYYYGDGDQRLFVDNASGYFYAFYATRALDKSGGGNVWLQHVARAPISQKMASTSWSKWYNGAWQSPGVGGAESAIIPADGTGNGYVAPADDYQPRATGSTATQVAAGTLPDNSQLAVMNVAWDAYLGKYIGTPQNNVAQATNTLTPLHFYATDDLATQKWTDMGLVPSDPNGAWYRWLLDPANGTSSTIVGKTFRSYCAYYCSTYTSEYSNITIAPTSAADLPAGPVKAGTGYQIAASGGQYLAQSGSSLVTVPSSGTSSSQQWRFAATGDGFYTVTNAASGQALGVGTGDAGRSWGTAATLGSLGSSPAVGQQWSFQAVTQVAGSTGPATPTGSYRLVNRYSGLALSLTAAAPAVVTAPERNWDNAGTAGDRRPAAAQALTFTAVAGSADLALNKPTTASSVQSGGSYAANLATDGDATTRWSSAFSDPQWLQVDLGAAHPISEVKLTWEVAYGRAFQIQTSNDGTTWTTLYSTTTGTGGTQNLTGLSGTGRYVRMSGTVRGTGYGYSLWSFQVYGG